MTQQAESTIEQYAPLFAQRMNVTMEEVDRYISDLYNDAAFLSGINEGIKDVPEFSGKQFQSVAEMRVYRVMLYLVTRILKPRTYFETGVHNGMSSAFILLGMEHNGTGELVSIDLPPLDQRILNQGTNELPRGKCPGWIIPNDLRHRHDLRLGKAERLLPMALEEKGVIDVFLHDSDHCYSHIMFELGISWPSVSPGGWLIVDNVEQNNAFSDFAKGVDATSFVVSSFDGPDRIWRHGLLHKATNC
jgi:predicted O-methyltransferase YrrM